MNGLDMETFLRRTRTAAARRGMIWTVLAVIGGWPLVLLHPPPKCARVLIAAGFHGEEPAGSIGILRWLETAPENTPVPAFLPAVNPTGLATGTRENAWGENTNDGFCHTNENGETPSREGLALLRNVRQLAELAHHGFVSLHEDCDTSRAYLYTFEQDEPGPFTTDLRRVLQLRFDLEPDGIHDGSVVKNGVVFHEHDGSFEDRMWHEGVPRTACTETPGTAPMPARVTCCTELVTVTAAWGDV